MTLELLRRRFDLYSYLENKPKFIPSERDLEEVVKSVMGDEDINFTLVIGENGSLSYFDKVTLAGQDKCISKLKPLAEITSRADLEKVVKDFIQSEPKENEIIDVRVETLRERMNLQRGKTVAISSFTMRKKTS